MGEKLKHLRKLFSGEKPHRPENPNYIGDDYELLQLIDPYLQSLIGRSEFQSLQTTLQTSATRNEQVVDLGASRNFLRGLIFFDTPTTIAVDPAYKWYDYHAADPFEPRPYPFGVFGGDIERQEMEKFLLSTCTNLQIPPSMNQEKTTSISGERHGKQRTFELVPENADEWLNRQQPQSIDNFVVYRIFPSASSWGKIVSSVKEGGIILTTGYGKHEQKPGETETQEFEPDMNQGGGVDVGNSPLPYSGNSEAVGLTQIAQFGQIHFYQKTKHLSPEVVSSTILKNK